MNQEAAGPVERQLADNAEPPSSFYPHINPKPYLMSADFFCPEPDYFNAEVWPEGRLWLRSNGFPEEACSKPNLTYGEYLRLRQMTCPCHENHALALNLFGLNPADFNETSGQDKVRELLADPERAAFYDNSVRQMYETLQDEADTICQEAVRTFQYVSGYIEEFDEELRKGAIFELDDGAEIRIVYGDHFGKESERDISVELISRENNDIYIEAMCHKRRNERTFRLSRIKNATEISTGLAIQDIKQWLLEKIQHCFLVGRRTRPHLGINVFIAKQHGTFNAAKRRVIADATFKLCSDLSLGGSAWDSYDRFLSKQRAKIDYAEFREGRRCALFLPESNRRILVEAAEQLVEANKNHEGTQVLVQDLRRMLLP